MLRRIIILALVSSVSAARDAGKIKPVYAFITDSDIRQFEEVIEGFRQSHGATDLRRLNLQGKIDAPAVKKFLGENKPALIVALGSIAATTVASLDIDTPVIFGMVLNHRRYTQLKKRNITGISMEIPARSWLTQFRLFFPELRGIAVPYNPDASAEIIQDAVVAAEAMKIRVFGISVSEPGAIGAQLSTHKAGDFNGLWMVADFKLYHQDSPAFVHLLEYSHDSKKPLLGASEAFVKAGAFFSVSINYQSLGSQLALVSRQILDDKVLPAAIAVAPPIGTYTVVNKKAGREILGARFSDDLLMHADKVYPEE